MEGFLVLAERPARQQEASVFTTAQMIRELMDVRTDDIPAAALERLKWAVLDDVGVTFHGFNMAGRVLVDYARDVGGTAESTVVGAGLKAGVGVTAGVNGMMSYLSNYSENGPSGHALGRITQTAIAMGERVGSSGREVLTAIAAVYELNGRLFHAARPREGRLPMPRRHQVLNVALVCGKLMRLDARRMNHLAGLAWLMPPPDPAGPLPSGSILTTIGGGNIFVCPLGVQAAILAEKGFEGPLDVLDRLDLYDGEKLARPWQDYPHIQNELYLKAWVAAGSGSHHGIDLATALIEEEGLQAHEVEEVRVFFRQPNWLGHPFDTVEPARYAEAMFSIPRAIALAVLGYEPGPAWFSPASSQHPEVGVLARKVRLLADPRPPDPAVEVSRRGIPYAHERQMVEVVARGRTFTKESAYGEVRGGPIRPLSPQEISAKFRRLVAPVLGVPQAEALLEALSALGDVDDVRQVTALYSPAG